MARINKATFLFLGFLGLFVISLNHSASFAEPGVPVSLKIEAIDVSAHVESVGLTSNGNLGISKNDNNVAWYKDGPKPGDIGSAVIAGHLDTKDSPKGIFYNLESLNPGDKIEVTDNKGQTFKFKVLGTKIYDYTDSAEEVFSATFSKPHLNLITCAGTWLPSHKMYNKRIVVFTELED